MWLARCACSGWLDVRGDGVGRCCGLDSRGYFGRAGTVASRPERTKASAPTLALAFARTGGAAVATGLRSGCYSPSFLSAATCEYL